MTIIESIFDAFGSQRKLAEATGIPPQTVSDWKSNNNIPHWRRPVILEAARAKGIALNPELATFLASREAA